MRKNLVISLAFAAAVPPVFATQAFFDECPVLYRLVQDPEFVSRVAKENGTSAARFYGIELPEQARMILAYGRSHNLCGREAGPAYGPANNSASGVPKR